MLSPGSDRWTNCHHVHRLFAPEGMFLRVNEHRGACPSMVRTEGHGPRSTPPPEPIQAQAQAQATLTRK